MAHASIIQVVPSVVLIDVGAAEQDNSRQTILASCPFKRMVTWMSSTIHDSLSVAPDVARNVWVAPGATIVGRVRIDSNASVWYGCVIRGDGDSVSVGEDSNIQDGAVLHVDEGFPCVIGCRVTIGHRAVVHGARIGDGALIGMGAIVMNGCDIGEQSLIAAGAVVLEGTVVEPRTLWAGVPARKIRSLDEAVLEQLESAWRHYVQAGRLYRDRFGSGSE